MPTVTTGLLSPNKAARMPPGLRPFEPSALVPNTPRYPPRHAVESGGVGGEGGGGGGGGGGGDGGDVEYPIAGALSLEDLAAGNSLRSFMSDFPSDPSRLHDAAHHQQHHQQVQRGGGGVHRGVTFGDGGGGGADGPRTPPSGGTDNNNNNNNNGGGGGGDIADAANRRGRPLTPQLNHPPSLVCVCFKGASHHPCPTIEYVYATVKPYERVIGLERINERI